MKSPTRLILTGLLCLTSLSVYAEQDAQVSRSVGKLVQDDSIELITKVKTQELVVIQAPSRDQSRETTATQSSGVETIIANRNDQLFSIYDANVSLLSDLDGDGFHHAINVSFDVDVSYDIATVYAKLYLSRDGGPWSQYHTTDLFEIYGDNYSDAYEVTTELIDGYPPGYYDVLIEVFSLNHAGIVTSQILDYYYLGKDVMLEDLSRDEGYYYEEVSYSHGAGSFSMIWLLLIVQVVTAARSAFTLTPAK
jgi:hypothetical protein